jgi:hypothetical protein
MKQSWPEAPNEERIKEWGKHIRDVLRGAAPQAPVVKEEELEEPDPSPEPDIRFDGNLIPGRFREALRNAWLVFGPETKLMNIARIE